jgi:hypothetical protein
VPCLRARVAAATARSRSKRSSPMGRRNGITPALLPGPAPPAVDGAMSTDTTTSSSRSPRRSRKRRSAPVTAVSTTSLTVVSRACASARIAVRSVRTVTRRRRGPVGRLREVRGAGLMPARSSSRPAARTLRRPVGNRRSAASRARLASARSCHRVGGGCGKPRALAATAGESTSCASTASPPKPSAKTWWNTATSATRSSAQPVTNVADHSGRDIGTRRARSGADGGRPRGS